MKQFLENDKFIKINIFDILLTEHGFNVILQSNLYHDKALQILVGFPDAHLLTVQFNKVRTSKPLLIDIMQYLLDMMKIKPQCALIYDIQDNHFTTRVFLEGHNKNRFMLEVKTSDALAMIMSSQGTILIDKHIFESRALPFNFYEDRGEEEAQQYKLVKIKELKEKLSIAISEERYEDAAIIRNEINKLTGDDDV